MNLRLEILSAPQSQIEQAIAAGTGISTQQTIIRAQQKAGSTEDLEKYFGTFSQFARKLGIEVQTFLLFEHFCREYTGSSKTGEDRQEKSFHDIMRNLKNTQANFQNNSNLDQNFRESTMKTRTEQTEQVVNYAELNDDELMHAISESSTPAFNELVNRYQDKLYSWLTKFLKNHDDIQDAIQETFMRVWDKRQAYKNTSQVKTWIFTIAKNYAFSELRKRTYRDHLSIQDLGHEDQDLPVVSVDMNPEQDTSNKSDVEKMIEVLPELKQKHQDILRLFYLEQLSEKEIIAKTGLALGTIKSRKYRAEQALRQHLIAVMPYRVNENTKTTGDV